MYRVELETRARRELLQLPRLAAAILADVIDDLRANPHPPAAKKLSGVDGYRVRQGRYRVLYTVDHKAPLVRIYRIGHRRDAYRR